MVNKDKKVGFRADGDKYEEFKEQCKKNDLSPSMILRKLMDDFSEGKIEVKSLFDNYDLDKVKFIKEIFEKNINIISNEINRIENLINERKKEIYKQQRRGEYFFEDLEKEFSLDDPVLEGLKKKRIVLIKVNNNIKDEMLKEINKAIEWNLRKRANKRRKKSRIITWTLEFQSKSAYFWVFLFLKKVILNFFKKF